MITFHKLTLAQYEKMLATDAGPMTDGLYFLTDTGVVKLHNEGGSVTTFGTTVEMVEEFPDSTNVQPYRIYTQVDTKEQRMWDGAQWQILSHPVTHQITSGIALSATTTLPDTYAVYNFVQDRVAAAELGVQVRLHTPVYSLEELQNLPLSDVEDKCMILVQNVGLYRYDAQSRVQDVPDTDAVVIPKEVQDSVPEGDNIDFYSGRWIKMFNNMSYINGNGVTISANATTVLEKKTNIISLNVNEDEFIFVDGKLTLNPNSQVVDSKVDKVSGHPDQIAIWKEDGNQDPSGFKFNTTNNLTSNNTTISPDSVISTFVHDITDKKLDDVAANSDGKIIVGKGNDGKVDASTYNIGTDFEDFTVSSTLRIPKKMVATERAVHWYVNRCMSFNNDNIGETLSSIIDPYE